MPTLKGLTAINRASGKGGGGGRKPETFAPMFNVPKGEVKYVHFITSIEDVVQVWLHQFVKVPNEKFKNGFAYDVFASRSRNSEFNDDYSVLETELDHYPDNKIAAIVVELEPVYDGKGKSVANIAGFNVNGNSITKDDGTELFFPSWGIIYQSGKTFWPQVVESVYEFHGEINTKPVRLKNGGDGVWNISVCDVPTFVGETEFNPLDDVYQIPSIEDEIKRLGSKERYDYFFGEGKPRLAQHQKFRPPVYRYEHPEAAAKEEAEREKAEAKPAPKKKKAEYDNLDDLLNEADEGSDEDDAPY